MLTHGNFAANALSLLTAWGITSADRYFAALPLFHVHGLGNGIQCWLASGCHMRLVERFEHEQACDWFEEYRPTLFFGVPTMYVRLLETAPERARAIGERMRLFVSGSAPLPAQVHEDFAALFGHVDPRTLRHDRDADEREQPARRRAPAGTVGCPLPLVAVRILDEAGEPVADDQTGELWVKGPNVCDGYWSRPDATAAAFVDGWFRTGDLGMRGADGYITLQGRRSDLIISGGFNIYPREIEEVLHEPARHPRGRGRRRRRCGAWRSAGGVPGDRRGPRRCGAARRALRAEHRVVQGAARVRPRRRAAAHGARQDPEAPAAGLDAMNPAYLSVIALLLVMAASFGTRLNVGVLAVALAWLVAVFGAGWKADAVMAVFPSSLFVTLLGVTLLFGVMQANGTMAALTQRAIRACGGRAGWLPLLLFALACTLSTMGPGAVATIALLAPVGMAAGARAGLSPLLTALMLGNGANAGNLSPFSAVGVIVSAGMTKAGVGGHEWQAWAANFVAHALAAALALGAVRRQATAARGARRGRWAAHGAGAASLGDIRRSALAWVAAVVFLKVNLGFAAFAAAAVLVLIRAGDDTAMLRHVPWSVIVMVCGVSLLVGVLEGTGGLDLFSTAAGAHRDAGDGQRRDRVHHRGDLDVQLDLGCGLPDVPADGAGTGAETRWRRSACRSPSASTSAPHWSTCRRCRRLARSASRLFPRGTTRRISSDACWLGESR